MLFDTLELSKALQPSLTPEQAEAFVHAIGTASSDQPDIVAINAEIADVKTAVINGAELSARHFLST